MFRRNKEISDKVRSLFEKIYRIEQTELDSLFRELFGVEICAFTHEFIKIPEKLGAERKVKLFSSLNKKIEPKKIFLSTKDITVLSDTEMCCLKYETNEQKMYILFKSVSPMTNLRTWLLELKKNLMTYIAIFLYVANRFRASGALRDQADKRQELITEIRRNLRQKEEEYVALQYICDYFQASWAVIFLCDQIRFNLVPVASSQPDLITKLSPQKIRTLACYEDIFTKGTDSIVCDELNKKRECNCKILSTLGAVSGFYLLFGHEPEIMGAPRGLLTIYYKSRKDLDQNEKHFLQYISREIASWINEKDELTERRIVEKSIASVEEECIRAEASRIDEQVFAAVLTSIEKHLQEAFLDTKIQDKSFHKVKMGVLTDGKRIGHIGETIEEFVKKDKITNPIIIYGDPSRKEAYLAWFPEYNKSFVLVIMSDMASLSLMRERVYESLRLILKLVYRLISIEQSRMTWTLRTIHEVRQPLQGLAAIAAEVQRLTKLESTSRREIRYWAEDMDTSILRMKVLLKSFDHLAGLDDVIPNTIPLLIERDVLRPIRRSITPVAETRNVNIGEPIGYDIIPEIESDPELLSIVFYNLLMNAIKYSPKNSKVSIYCGEINEDFWIQVENDGPEIYEDEVEKIFMKGFRGRNARKLEGGLGLGLSVSKLILEKLGFSFELLSRGQKMSKVIFRIYIPKGLIR